MPSPQNVHTQSSQCSCPVLFGYDSSQSRNKRGCRLKTHLLLLTMFYICVSCTEQTPLDPKGTIVYESILLQHLLQISTTEAWDFNSCCSDRGDRLWNDVAFIWSHILRNAHQVLLQTVSSIFGNFMKHFLFQLFDCFIIKHSVKFLSVFGGHLVSWNTPPRKEGSYA
jgi:hypothetical protein